jgi:hypothetical protein
MITVSEAGLKTIKVSPLKEGKELFKLSRIIVKPIK